MKIWLKHGRMKLGFGPYPNMSKYELKARLVWYLSSALLAICKGKEVGEEEEGGKEREGREEEREEREEEEGRRERREGNIIKCLRQLCLLIPIYISIYLFILIL